MNNINIVGFTGSLRKKSYNMATLLAAKEMMPKGVTLDIIDISLIPFFNEDLENNIPDSVANFKNKIASADGILIATPEYNFSIPPVLKNALDWASRGDFKPLEDKPLAVMSASPSMLGGARVQYHLRQVCCALNLQPINRPEVFIAKAYEKFNDEGKLVDDITKKAILELVTALIEKIRQ